MLSNHLMKRKIERQLEKSRHPWSNFRQKEMETFA